MKTYSRRKRPSYLDDAEPPAKRPRSDDDDTSDEAPPLFSDAAPRGRTGFSFFARRAAAGSQDAKRKRLTQLQLDLGAGPVQRTCLICGMAYVPSNAEDAGLHKRFHASQTLGVEVGKGFAKSGESALAEVVWEARGEEAGFVVAVGSRDRLAAKTRAKSVLEMVERELGAVPISGDELWSQVTLSGNDGDCKTDGMTEVEWDAAANRPERKRSRADTAMRGDRFRAYLYISGSRCIGLCLAECIDAAHRVVDQHADGANPARTEADNQSRQHTTTPVALATSTSTHPATLGISRIWVSSLHRRRGVAIALLNATACDYFCANGSDAERDAPKERIAFSQPTESGAALARRWFGAKTGWGVYW